MTSPAKKPAGLQPGQCGAAGPRCYCTRPEGHHGPHAGAVNFTNVVDAWQDISTAPPAPARIATLIDDLIRVTAIMAAERASDVERAIATDAVAHRRNVLASAILDLYAKTDPSP